MYLNLLKRLQQNIRTHIHTHTNICFMRCTIFSSRFVGEGGWVGITLKCEYKKGGMQRAVSFQAHISKSFSPWNVWWVCIIYTLCFTSLVSQHFTSFSWIRCCGPSTHCLIFSFIKGFAYIMVIMVVVEMVVYLHYAKNVLSCVWTKN